MKELSRITENFSESVIRLMTRLCNAAGGYNLSQGFPDFGSPQAVKDAAIKAINDELNQYPITFGEPELRQAICEKARTYNNLDCDPETEVTVTCGATEAMIASLKALINPGDEIIIFEPFYENYGPDAILSGAVPRYVSLNPPDWSYCLEDLAAAFNENTKAIILNTPNNPTGKVFSREELAEIADLCHRWDVYAITDEIYEHILYDGAQHISLATLPGMRERTITINSISKTYAATGWRVGWAIAPERLTARIRKVHDFLTVGAPTPLQHAAVTALNLPTSYYHDLQHKYGERRTFMLKLLQDLHFRPYQPAGSYYIICEASTLMRHLNIKDDFEFCRRLIDLTGVATVPGSSFFSQPEKGRNLVRFCFCKKWETLYAVRDAFKQLPALI